MRVDPSGCAWWEFWKCDWAKIGMIALSVVEVVVGTALILSGNPLGMAIIGTAVGSVINGYMNEANGGSFFGGWMGGQISGFVSIIPGIGPTLGVLLGSITTDLIDNTGDWDRVNWEKAGFSALIGWGLSIFPGVIGSVAKELGKNIALYFTVTFDSLLLSICNSIVNVFW